MHVPVNVLDTRGYESLQSRALPGRMGIICCDSKVTAVPHVHRQSLSFSMFSMLLCCPKRSFSHRTDADKRWFVMMNEQPGAADRGTALAVTAAAHPFTAAQINFLRFQARRQRTCGPAVFRRYSWCTTLVESAR
jgi:hypothetical protein